MIEAARLLETSRGLFDRGAVALVRYDRERDDARLRKRR